MEDSTTPLSEKRFAPIPDGKWINNLCIHEFTMPGGKKGRWESLDEGDTPTVLLCGLTKQKNLILVNLFRFPVQTFCFELPGGLVDPGETPEEAVIREFLKETGYRPEKVSHLCRGFLYNGKSNKKFEIWVGEECEKVSEIELDDVEKYAQLTVAVMDVREVMKRISEGQVDFDPCISQAIIALREKGMLWTKMM